VDSDFDAQEDAESEGEDSEAEAAAAAKEKRAAKAARAKAAKYKEPARPKVAQPELTAEEEAQLKEERREAARMRKEAAMAANADRAKRVSTQRKTAAAAKEREKKDREQARQRVLAPPKPRATKCTFTQEELLLEACATEQENAKWLLGRKRMQDETDDAAHAPKRQGKLAARFISRRGCPNVVNFPQVEGMPLVLRDSAEQEETLERRRARAAEQPKGRTKCVVTGLPAKYRDPRTGLPYANADAFKALRVDPRRFAALYKKQRRQQQQQEGAGEAEAEEMDEGEGDDDNSSSAMRGLKGGGGTVISRVSSSSSFG
jgi:vacuolar protein sorting-associated protein 72